MRRQQHVASAGRLDGRVRLAVTVKRGDSVVWINEDPFPHTVTAAGAFDSKSIAADGSWKYRPLRAGEFAYTCTFHPNMKGTLNVQ
jgi:plastocyanin